MEKKSKLSVFTEGIFRGNQPLVFLIGMCPTLAVTDSINKAISMAIAFFAVLFFSNLIISAVKNLIPDEVRLPAFIIIVASLVTIVSMLLQAFAYTVFESLGVFLSLIVVNCIILGRAEAFASKNSVKDSILDACGVALGYLLALLLISGIREILSTGGIALNIPLTDKNIFSLPAIYAENESLNAFINLIKMSFFATPAGAFITLGIILAVVAVIKNRKKSAGAK